MQYCMTMEQTRRIAVFFDSDDDEAAIEKANQILYEIFCENWQNPVKQRITPHFLTTSPSNYYEFTTKE